MLHLVRFTDGRSNVPAIRFASEGFCSPFSFPHDPAAEGRQKTSTTASVPIISILHH